MKLTFLGSSNGFPHAFRKLSCIMLQINSNIYFFDMGTPVTEYMARKGLDTGNVKGVFISHMHGDHMDGLIDFLDLSTWWYKGCNPEIIIPDLAVKDCIGNYLNLLGISLRDEIKFSEVKAGTVFDDGVLRVTAYPTMHTNKSFAYMLEAEGRRILYTSDLKHPDIDMPNEALKCPLDLIICEGAHFNTNDYLPYIEKAQIKKVCINHYPADRIPEILQLKAAIENTPVILANDEMEFEF